jgi:hypothetical protein
MIIRLEMGVWRIILLPTPTKAIIKTPRLLTIAML